MQGTVKKLISDKGFGFITPQGGGDDVFFHMRDMHPEHDFDYLQEGATVSYEMGAGRDGRTKGVNVAVIAAEDTGDNVVQMDTSDSDEEDMQMAA